MSALRQYDLARIASHAWPQCSYRLIRVPDEDALAPAVFVVMNETRRMGTLAITAREAKYGGDLTPELRGALAVVYEAHAAATIGWPRP